MASGLIIAGGRSSRFGERDKPSLISMAFHDSPCCGLHRARRAAAVYRTDPIVAASVSTLENGERRTVAVTESTLKVDRDENQKHGSLVNTPAELTTVREALR